jgi:hypothetical protein
VVGTVSLKPPSRHINATQRAGMAIVLITLVVVFVGAAPWTDLSDGIVEVCKAAIYALAAAGGGMGTVSAGRDVAKAWKGPQKPEDETP